MTFAVASELGLSPKLVFLFDPEDDEYLSKEGGKFLLLLHKRGMWSSTCATRTYTSSSGHDTSDT
jgi:hypothetical protein